MIAMRLSGFKDREQAESFVAEFADALLNPQVLDPP